MERKLGANYQQGSPCEFVVWAPRAEKVAIRLPADPARTLPMTAEEGGYWSTKANGIKTGTDYFVRLNGTTDLPDPASRWQPQGVFQASQVISSTSYSWQDKGWTGRALEDYVIYELHVGCFTPQATFTAIIPYLSELADLGVTAIELMPVAQFSGRYNWGYDAVFPFAVHNGYGHPDDLKQLVDACHQAGMAVILDVVYNHLGPEGNVLEDFAPYFTDRYRTPWGKAVNFDGPESDNVRAYFINNALYWLTEFHIDALRLDAIHSIHDTSAVPFLRQLADRVHHLAPARKHPHWLIAENDHNDVRVIEPSVRGGHGFDAQWNDDFHHALHSLLTGEKNSYYCDFGRLADLAKAFQEGYIYGNSYSPYRRRHHGSNSAGLPGYKFVAYSQNHDQVGNRMQGKRLLSLTSYEAAKLAAATTILAPSLPLIFMGEEFAAETPFLFFADFQNPDLQQAVCHGRQDDLESEGWEGTTPDPTAIHSYERSKLDRQNFAKDKAQTMFAYYQELLRLRRTLPSLMALEKDKLEVTELRDDSGLILQRRGEQDRTVILLNFSSRTIAVTFPLLQGSWEKRLDSGSLAWRGAGSRLPNRAVGGSLLSMPPKSAALYQLA